MRPVRDVFKPEEFMSALREPTEAELWDEFVAAGLQPHELRALTGEEDLWAVPGVWTVQRGDRHTGFKVIELDGSDQFLAWAIEHLPLAVLDEFQAALARKALSGPKAPLF